MSKEELERDKGPTDAAERARAQDRNFQMQVTVTMKGDAKCKNLVIMGFQRKYERID